MENSANNNMAEKEDPLAREWRWVLTTPITVHRDSMLILEGDSGDFVPVFQNKEEASKFLQKLEVDNGHEYNVQAMHLLDVRKFALSKSLMLLTLDADGHIVEHWTPDN